MTTPAQRFTAAHQRGIAASFARGDITVKMKEGPIPVPGCLLSSGTNKAQAEEYGLQLLRTLDLQIPKTALPRRPSIALDLITYQGRDHTIATVEGDDEFSPVWALSCTAPL